MQLICLIGMGYSIGAYTYTDQVVDFVFVQSGDAPVLLNI